MVIHRIVKRIKNLKDSTFEAVKRKVLNKRKPSAKKLVSDIIHKRQTAKSILKRAEVNPIISPRAKFSWESKATFNPAAIYAGKKVHLVYRAIGNDDVSVLGYASSSNAIDFDERLNYPIFYKGQQKLNKTVIKIPYSSGGGWNGGTEDPRLTLIDKTVYLFYTAFDGWGSLRMAMSTISLDDFLHKNFNWTQPVYISKSGEIHKNWVLFPEKINGKFAILHSVNPSIMIEYVDDLQELGRDKYVKSFYGSSSSRPNKEINQWDNWVRGAGPPPIKTKYGWLLLYHAMDKRDPNRYKLGAMILDLKDPTKILYRSNQPILEPDEDYENEGFKSGVVYSCGAVVANGELYVYYGGADTVVAVAEANLEQFLQQLMKNSEAKLLKTDRDKMKVIIK